MESITPQGKFSAIDSFAIRRKNEFYIIGQIKEGDLRKGWYINIPLNRSISLGVKVNDIEDIEISDDHIIYKLLIVSGDDETLDLLLGLKIGSEELEITIEGEE